MYLFLTSDPGGVRDMNGQPSFRPLSKENGFTKLLRSDIRCIKKKYNCSKALLITADPDNHSSNDEHLKLFTKAFRRAFIFFSKLEMCDSRNPEIIDNINEYACVFLLGGHVPTQNSFFKEINLAEKISSYKGVLLALSAGSMNCSSCVYLLPEYPQDLEIPVQNRFVTGLGLTDIQIIPHFQYLKTCTLEGRNLIYDIAREDSHNHEFVGLNDGSFIYIDTQTSDKSIYGEYCIIKNGILAGNQ